jgi:hypothetical protein
MKQMARKEKDVRSGNVGARQIMSRGLLFLLLAVSLLVPIQGAHATVQSTSGSVSLGNILPSGVTSYTVDYTYPSTATVGTNLTISLTLHVNSLSGNIEYVTNYKLLEFLYIGSQLVGNSAIKSPLNASYLYAGASWGPNNVTIPLTAANTGLATGQSANASLSITMQDEVFYATTVYVGYYQSEPAMEGQAGEFLIQNVVPSSSTSTSTSTSSQNSGQSYVPYALLASGAVLMVLAVALPRRPQVAPKPEIKTQS